LKVDFNEIVGTETKIDFLDIQGLIIKSVIVDKSKNEISIDISNFKSGIMFLIIYNDNDIIVRKIIKQ